MFHMSRLFNIAVSGRHTTGFTGCVKSYVLLTNLRTLHGGKQTFFRLYLFGSAAFSNIMRFKGYIMDGIKNIFSDVEIKLGKKNKLLFSRDSQCLQELIKRTQLQNHRTLVIWALDCAKLPLEQFEAKYPDERRPRTCLKLCESWARGKIKMPLAKHAILDSHAAAKEIGDSEYAALCHAIGHAGATVHVETHALGLPIYELTAIVLKYGKLNFQKPISEKINYYYNRLLYWQENGDKLKFDWADFLLDEAIPIRKNH